jgi:rhodanese-related sulfurtransferase
MTFSFRTLVGDATAKIENVSPKAAFDEKSSGKVVFLDVREPMEWEEHIEGALQVPRGLLEAVGDPECGPHLPPSLQVGLRPTQRVIVYCNTGARAILSTLTLKTMGYEHVANLQGGLKAWKEAGLPTAQYHLGI